MVDRILAAKRDNAESDTGKLEEQIDRLVYKLYDLTNDEIAIVEGKAEEPLGSAGNPLEFECIVFSPGTGDASWPEEFQP